ncbi:MAG: class II glutamine amidotransferase [Acidobacteriota bacterium]
MCRWVAYSGGPIYLEELIFKPQHSLIDQSLQAFQSPTTTNGDGFGVGWYGDRIFPGVFKDTRPAWNDANLRDVAAMVKSGLFLAHVRATTGSAIQRSNCHPFRHGRWLLMHNGLINDYKKIRRQLAFAVSDELFPFIEGTTDTELMMYLALTFGLEEDVETAVARMVGFVEQTGRAAGVEYPMQMTLGISDGDRLYAFRYSTLGESRTLFISRSIAALEEIHPEVGKFPQDAIAIVSEPLSDLSGVWEEIPESSLVVCGNGEREIRPFSPIHPAI